MKNQNSFFQLKLGQDSTKVELDLKSIVSKLSKTQLHAFKSMNDVDKIKYVLSFQGDKVAITKPELKLRQTETKWTPEFMREGRILDILREQCNTDKAKKPTSQAFHFGIEIECLIPKENLGYYLEGGSRDCAHCDGTGKTEYVHPDTDSEITGPCPYCNGSGINEDCEFDADDADNSQWDKAAVDCVSALVKQHAIRNCQVKEDGSLTNDCKFVGAEIAVLTTDFKNLEKLTKALKSIDAEVDSSCGLHVHLDARHCSIQKHYNNTERRELDDVKLTHLNRSLTQLFKMLPKSRQDNRYCQKGFSYSDRYHAINLTALNKFGTVEIRCHSGTTDFDKIKNWCMILKTIFDCTKTETPVFNSLKHFTNYFEFSPSLVEYINKRVEKFSGEVSEKNDADCEDAA